MENITQTIGNDEDFAIQETELANTTKLRNWLNELHYFTFSGSVYEVINLAQNYEDGSERLEQVFRGLADNPINSFDKGLILAKEVLKERFVTKVANQNTETNENKCVACGDTTFNEQSNFCSKECIEKMEELN